MFASLRPFFVSVLIMLAFVIWLYFRRWEVLKANDLIIILFIAGVAAMGVFVVFTLIGQLRLFRWINSGWPRYIFLPIIGWFSWLFVFGRVSSLFVMLATSWSLEHVFNNSIQFVWHTAYDFARIVFIAIFLCELGLHLVINNFTR